MAERWNAYPPRPASGPPRQAPETITAIARRYYSCAVALSTVMGLPLTEGFLQAHHAAIACTFIESGRAGVRLPGGVSLPPLMEPVVGQDHGQGERTDLMSNEHHHTSAPDDGHGDPPAHGEAPATSDLALPTVVPAGCPCAGQAIAALKPAALSMVLSKVASLVHDQGDQWLPLLHALNRERAARIERGRRPTLVAGDGHGG